MAKYQKTIGLRVKDDQLRELERLAQKFDTSTASIVRQAVNKFLEDYLKG